MIRVFLIDDHPIVIKGLQRVFDTINDIDITAVFENGRVFWDAFESGALKDFDVLIVDIDIPELDGVQVFEKMLKSRPDIPVVFYTRQPENEFALELLRRGAAAFLSKDQDTDFLVEAIRIAHYGEVYKTPRLRDLVTSHARATFDTLSQREKDVFERIVGGQAPAKIASQLGIARPTVSKYLARIREKLHLQSNSEMIRYAYRNGLVY